MHIAVFQHFRPGEEIRLHFAGHGVGGRLQAAWGNRTKIKGLGRAAGGHHLREANPAQAAIPGFQRRQRKGRGHRRICRRAAGFQNGHTGLGGAARLGRHHALAARGCGLRDMPMLGCMTGRGPGHDRVSSISMGLASRRLRLPATPRRFAPPSLSFYGTPRILWAGQDPPLVRERANVCIKGAFCCPHSEEFY